MTRPIRKYPRTHHLEGSRLQPGDEDLTSTPLSLLHDRNLVVEEKLDGANAAVSFDDDGELLLQSRGHYLTGGPRERHFALFKTWAQTHRNTLHRVLDDRYVMYGEWLYAKHTVFYDLLPHYFLEFDVLDLERDVFLATPMRRELLATLYDTVLSPVPVLFEGLCPEVRSLPELVGPSRFKSDSWRLHLEQAAEAANVDVARCVAETDLSDESEGLYIKVEEGGEVVGRYKWVRAGFLTAVLDSGSHWHSRTIVENRLAPGVDLFEVG